jgi:hypothetical protein
MALDDIKKALAGPKADMEEESEDMESTESESGGGLAKAAKAVQAHIDGDPAKLGRALKAFVSMCKEEDY